MVICQGCEYEKVNKFDCHIVDLDNFFTVIPISPKEYRDKNPTKAAVRIEDDGTKTTFKINNDWGALYSLTMPNHMAMEISIAKEHAVNDGLLVS